MKDISINK